MSYFRQPKKGKKPLKTTDGFITRSNTPSADIQGKHRTNYSPVAPSVADISSKPEGFTTRQPSNVLNQEAQTNLDAEDHSFLSQPIPIEEDINKKSRRKLKRHQRLHSRKKSSIIRRTVKSFSVLLVAFVIGVASLFGYGYIKSRNVFRGNREGAAALQKNVDPIKLNGEGDGRINILLIGKGGPGHDGPDLTDTLLLASIDPIKNEAALVSVPRDLYVKDIRGYSTKINAIYANSKQARLANGSDTKDDLQAAEDVGLSAIKQKISDVLGIPVHYYVMVDFDGFKDAIDTVGGIDVDVKNPLYDSTMAWLNNNNPLIADTGLQTFDGYRALLYARSRHGSARGDFDRTERQREIILALQKKVLSIGTFSNPFKVIDLLGTFGSKVRTDLNGLGEIKRLYEIGKNIGGDSIASVGLADPPNILVRTDNINSLSVVVPSEGLYQYDKIHSFIRNKLRDAFLNSEDAKVVILNGTDTPGLATATANELRSYGYNVITVDNAPTLGYIHNVMIDLSNGENRYTKSYMERRLGLTAVTEKIDGLPSSDEADFVIILGTDEVIKTTN